jgi:hypothetical protein
VLFESRFHDGLRRGSIVLTFRLWPSARVVVGRRYRCKALGFLEVDSVDKVRVGSIRPAEARKAGFEDAAALTEYLARVSRRSVSEATRVWRVGFHFAGEDERPALARSTGPADVRAVSAKLDEMDRRARGGAWAWRTLELIARNPRVVAWRLAPEMGQETRAFKTNVRKLKGLGLTLSLEVGYELSPRGAAVLASRARSRR